MELGKALAMASSGFGGGASLLIMQTDDKSTTRLTLASRLTAGVGVSFVVPAFEDGRERPVVAAIEELARALTDFAASHGTGVLDSAGTFHDPDARITASARAALGE